MNFSERITKLVVYLVLTVFLVYSLVPLVWVWVTALKSGMEVFYNPIGLPKTWRFDNLLQAWTVGKFNIFFFNSLFIAIIVVVLVVGCSALAGYAFARINFWGNLVLFGVLLAGLAMPVQAILIPLYHLLRDMHLIDTRWAVILAELALGLPFGTFLMRAFFKDLPNELVDAARIDGCGTFGIFIRIMLPLSKPALLTLCVFQFMGSWKDFILPLTILHTENLRTMPLGVMYYRSRYFMDYGMMAAGVMIMSLPIIIVYIWLQREFIRGLTAGAVKG